MSRTLCLKSESVFQTPAKINFHLEILRKRPDSFHEIRADFYPVSLFDEIQLLPSNESPRSVSGFLSGIDSKNNTLIKAVRLLEKRLDIRFHLSIKINKQIPSGAGMGGGSSNAGGLLVKLNRLFELGLNTEDLEQISAEIGADVPFFINPEPSIRGGLGEIKLGKVDIEAMKTTDLLIFKPDFSIPTPDAYASVKPRVLEFFPDAINPEYLRKATPEINGFWSENLPHFDQLRSLNFDLKKEGCQGVFLTGSGSGLILLRSKKVTKSNLEKKFTQAKIFEVKLLQNYEY